MSMCVHVYYVYSWMERMPEIVPLRSCPANASSQSTSHRLGNLLSAWWFSAQPHPGNFNELESQAAGGGEGAQFELLRMKQRGGSLGALVAHSSGKRRQVSALSSSCLIEMQRVWLKEENVAQTLFTSAHQIYITELLIACNGAVMELFGNDIRRQLRRYSQRLDRHAHKASATASATATHAASPCVVHFRLGDMLTIAGGNRSAINPRSVAAAVATFDPPPSMVEIMDGGIEWVSASASEERSASRVTWLSQVMLGRLVGALREALPSSTRIVGPIRRSAEEDFFVMASAPRLVLAGGSFGLAAALAGRVGHQEVRSPACGHHLDLLRTARQPHERPLRHGWSEYVFNMVVIR